MNVRNAERNGNAATIVVEIEKTLIESGMDKAYKKQRRNIQIPGFRKGKASRKMIEAMYGANVFFEDGLEEIFPEVYKFAVEGQDFKALGRPNLTDIKQEEDGSVTLTMTTQVYPEVTLGQYKGLEVEKQAVTVSDEQVQKELDQMAENVASIEDVDDRPAAMGDTAVIDFEGFDDGVPFEGGEGEDYELKLGSGQFIPGFEEQVVGMSIGEEKDISVTFPEDYHENTLAGKPVIFHVKLHELSVTDIPDQDDEFAKDVSEFDTLEELKGDIRAKLMEKAQKDADEAFEEEAMSAAAANTTVELPEALIEEELDSLLERFAYQLQMGGISMEQYASRMGGDMNTMRKVFRPSAQQRARISVTLEQIVKEEGITVTEEEIQAELESLAKQYELEPEKVRNMVPAEELTASLTTRKARKLIVDTAIPIAPKTEEATGEAAEEATE